MSNAEQMVSVTIPGTVVAELVRAHIMVQDQPVPADATVTFELDIEGWTLKCARISWEVPRF